MRYRCYAYRTTQGYTGIGVAANSTEVAQTEKHSAFVRWIHKEWQESPEEEPLTLQSLEKRVRALEEKAPLPEDDRGFIFKTPL